MVLLALPGCGPPPARGPVPGHSSIDRLVYSEFEGSRLARRIHADQLLVVPKRIGIFQITPVNELVLTRARIELFLETVPEGRASAQVSGAAQRDGLSLPALGGAGRRVAGAKVYALEGVIVRDGAPVARVEAARASAESRTGDLVLEGFRMVHLPTARRLSADRAVWRLASSEFVVRGAWAMEDGEVRSSGHALHVDADLQRVGAP